MDWQPMETAPKDGKLIIVCLKTGNVWCDVRWVKRKRAGERWEHLSLGALPSQPKYWMPIPSDPINL